MLYLYDAENRICAVQQVSTGGGRIGYLYDPNGVRFAKGTLSSFSCDLTKNGLTFTSVYAVGPQGEQVIEGDGSFNLVHFNIFWEGKGLGTYTGNTLAQSNWHFALNDWVGTKRQLTKSDGTSYSSFDDAPFGDYQSPGALSSPKAGSRKTGKWSPDFPGD